MKTFLIKEVQSLNSFNNKRGFNNRDYTKYKKLWYEYLFYKFGKHTKEKKFKTVIITRIYGKGCREFDNDNFIGGCKPIPDCLRELGHIWNDTNEWAKMEYYQKSVKELKDFGINEAGTLIEVI